MINNKHNFLVCLNTLSDAICAFKKDKVLVYVNNSFVKNHNVPLNDPTEKAINLYFNTKTLVEIDKFMTQEDDEKKQCIFSNQQGLAYEVNRVELDDDEVFVLSEKGVNDINMNESLALASAELISPSLSIDNIARVLFKASLTLTGGENGFVAFDDPLSDNILVHYFHENYIKDNKLESNFTFYPRDEYFRNGFYGYAIKKYDSKFENEINLSVKKKIGINCPSAISNYIAQPAVVNEVFLGHLVIVNSKFGFSEKHIKIIAALGNVYAMAIFRKRMEWDLLHAKDKAEESDRLKSAFLANMSHEIRTPMNAIVGFSDLLISNSISDEKKVEFNKLVQSSCDDLLFLVNDIVDISKIEAGMLKFYPNQFEVSELFNEIYELGLQKMKSTNKSVKLIFNKEESISANIFLDRSRLKQVLQNLLGNAIKFTETGSITIGYHFNNKNLITFFIKDTGIGISKEDQKNVFDSFRQLETTISRNFGGTGLGLAISKSIVNQLGGELNLKSTLGKGTHFSFSIPFRLISEHPELEVGNFNNHNTNLLLEGKTILVVEDEPNNIKLIKILLQETKADILVANNGLEAVEMVISNNPDLVLMDIRMPKMDGLEATMQIKEINNSIPIIAQTAYAMKEDREYCLEIGCSDYVSKPLRKKELYNCIRNVL